MTFDWEKAARAAGQFGGEPVTLHIPKTGLPFFDALQLYGGMDLYLGLREDVTVHDAGGQWVVTGRRRTHLLGDRDLKAFRHVWAKSRPQAKEYCHAVRHAIETCEPFRDSCFVDGRGEWDSSLQDGIRGIAAREYVTLQSAQTSKKECKAQIPLNQALFAMAGKARTEGIGNVVFLPLFEGAVDLSKVVSPLRMSLRWPNVLCSQAAALLSLKASLFAEGYQDQLSAVVFDTDLGSQRSDNYSGIVSIASTAVGRIKSSRFLLRLQRSFFALVQNAWKRQGRNYQKTEWVPDALAFAGWLLNPAPKNLSAMILSAERLQRNGLGALFTESHFVEEAFRMSYENWQGDHEAVRKFAKAVASGIRFARMAKEKEFDKKMKAWYDEITVLRSAPSAKAFIERALILIEQGHREHSQVGTKYRGEDFDPEALEASLGSDRGAFDAFRDLFRMYLIQESIYQQPTAEAESVMETAAIGGQEEFEQ